ncbi:MAG: hypothetical protein ACOCQ3_05485 [Natronomonas sp.]
MRTVREDASYGTRRRLRQATMQTNAPDGQNSTERPVEALVVADRWKLTDGSSAGAWILAESAFSLEEVR